MSVVTITTRSQYVTTDTSGYFMCRNLMWAYQKPKKDKRLKKEEWTYKTECKFICAVKEHPEWKEWKSPHNGTALIKIPCGQCIDCRLQKSREWANRCLMELKDWTNNYFITMTYDDKNLKYNKGIIQETGEITNVATLQPKDHELFMKKLRIHYERKYKIDKIRFFMCGEYGSSETYTDYKGNIRQGTSRPHYHYIMFNLPIYDLKFSHNSHSGVPIYTSEELSKIWGKGIVTVQEVNWEACAYTARYILKKQTGKNSEEYYKLAGKEPEFTRCSRRPGIGWNYYDKNKHKMYLTDEIIIQTTKGIQSVKPASYYDRLFDIEEPTLMSKIKQQRKIAATLKEESELKTTDKSYKEWQETKEYLKDCQIKALKRQYDKEGIY